MSRERLLKTLKRQYADKIPHKLIMNHPEFIKHITGIDSEENPLDAALRFHELYEVEIGGPLSLSNQPIKKTDSHGIKSEASPETEWYISSPFKTVEEVLAFDADPYGKDAGKALYPGYALQNFRWLFETNWNGQKQKDIEVWDKIEKLYPGKFTPGAGFYTTAFMWPIMIFGWDLFLEAGGLYPDETGALIKRLSAITKKYFEYVSESIDLFMVPHDDIAMAGGPVFNPSWYRKYIFPIYEEVYEPVRKVKKPIIFMSDGNLSMFLDDIRVLNPDGVSFEISTDLDQVINTLGKDKIIEGNIDCRVIEMGTKDDIFNEIKRVAQKAQDIPGFILCCTNGLNSNVPLKNMQYYFDAVEMLRIRN